MYEKEKEEKSNNVCVTIDITKVAEIIVTERTHPLHFLACLRVY